MNLGDYAVGVTLDFFFTTRRFTTGAPFTLAGSPVLSIYEDNGTTEITAGITLTVDFDARTGLNQVRIVATGANGFEAGKSYTVVITTGTVDSVSVVGEVVGFFTLERAAALTIIPTADQNAAALLKYDWSTITGEAARSVLNALRAIRNKWSITGAILTVTKEDDTASAWTSTLTESAGANPYSGSDPA